MDQYYEELAEFFKVFGDATRLKILKAIENGGKCVGDISEEVSQSLSTVSHQLRILRDKRLVRSQKKGKQVFYSLDDNHILEIIHTGKIHLKEAHHE